MINVGHEPRVISTSDKLALTSVEVINTIRSLLPNAFNAELREADGALIRNAYLISTVYRSTPKDGSKIQDVMKLIYKTPVKVNDYGKARAELQWLLVGLWANGCALLPQAFVAPTKNTDGAKQLDSVFMKSVFSWLDDNSHPDSVKKYWRKFAYMLDWSSFDDSNAEDVYAFAKAVSRKEFVTKTPYLAIAGLFKRNAESSINAEDIRLITAYKNTYGSVRDSEKVIMADLSFKDFAEYESKTKERYDDLIKREGIKYKDKQRKKKRAEKLAVELEKMEHMHGKKCEALAYVLSLSDTSLKSYNHTNWITDGRVYLDSEHCGLDEKSTYWKPLFEAYYSHVKRKTSGKVKSKLQYMNVFADYLFGYLPVWFYHNTGNTYKYPSTPNEFKRVLFWNNNATKLPNAPLTAIEVYLARRSRKTAQAFIREVADFFEFVSVNYTNGIVIDKIVVSNTFSNPVNVRIDSVGSGSRGSNKTNKVPLPRTCLPILLKYLLALESIGESMQYAAINDGHNFEFVTNMAGIQSIELNEFGLEPVAIIHGGKEFEITELPTSLFSWHKGVYEREDGTKTDEMMVPWLSCLRMLIGCFSAGTRMQNMQWLDINTFDMYFDEEGSYFYPLYINTDKSGESRVVRVHKYAAESLMKEKEFQLSCMSSELKSVPYEANELTTYDDIMPLFRSPFSNDGYPFADMTYSQIWVLICHCFGQMYNSAFLGKDDKKHEFTYYSAVRSKGSTGGQKVLSQMNSFGESVVYNEYTPVSLKAFHTPHSLRSTYITHRRGIVPDHILMEQVGHADKVVTDRYTVDEEERLEQLLEYSDKVIMGEEVEFQLDDKERQIIDAFKDAEAFENKEQATVRAAKMTSNLRKSVSEDVQSAVNDQALIAISVYDDDDNAIEILKRKPLSEIQFFDCNICPFGGVCPKEALEECREQRRCGLCPFAIFSVDNLPAIAAKRRKLIDMIKSGKEHLELLVKRGEPEDVVSTIRDTNILNLEEQGAWQVIESILKSQLEVMKSGDFKFLSRKPEIIEKHLKSVAVSSESERLLVQLADANTFPALQDEKFIMKARRFTRKIALSDIENETDYVDEVQLLCSKIASIMRLHGVGIERLANKTDFPVNLLPNKEAKLIEAVLED